MFFRFIQFFFLLYLGTELSSISKEDIQIHEIQLNTTAFNCSTQNPVEKFWHEAKD